MTASRDPVPEALAASPWDVIVVGAGAGGMTAACVAAREGCRTLLLEQSAWAGGTTAISGGMVWIPANHLAASCGRRDDLDAARAYLAHTVPNARPALVEAFLSHGDEAIGYLERHTDVRLRPVATYPDYYPDLPGATLGGRVLEPVPFDARALGRDFPLLREPLPEFMLMGGMMVSRQDMPHLRRVGKSARSTWHAARLAARYALQRLHAPRGTELYLGNALAGRLLRSVRDCGVELALRTAVTRLERGQDCAFAVEIESSGRRTVLAARRAVVLATGGLSHDFELRRSYVPQVAGALSAAVAPESGARGARLALDVGAALAPSTSDGAFWVPASTFDRPDGTRGVYPHTVTDRGKPGLIAVASDGRRFVNEALSYHEFVRAQFRHADRAIPAWLVCDRAFLWTYGLGRVKPFTLSLARHLESGYLRRGDSVASLAAAIGVPATALAQTFDAFNRGARAGADHEFGRGSDAYQRHLGDADVTPNPCVAPLEHAPFFAVAVRPADLGMAAGILTDANARALDGDGHAIAGLYACGNDMHSIMEGAYPGPGITLGPALTFGYLAARHAAHEAPGA